MGRCIRKVYFIASATGDFAPVDCEIHENISDWRISENGQDDFKKFDVHLLEGARVRIERDKRYVEMVRNLEHMMGAIAPCDAPSDRQINDYRKDVSVI